MSLEYQFRPITVWLDKETPPHQRSKARFKKDYAATINLLERELRFLKAKQIVIQAFLSESDIRIDGMIRATARTNKPGIILSFNSMHGPLQYPCDTFDKWEDNLRGIALSLESLRQVERYGVTKRGEQYTGWQMLPVPDDPETVIRSFAPGISALKDAIREAFRKTHPDVGGNPENFIKVKLAAEALNL